MLVRLLYASRAAKPLTPDVIDDILTCLLYTSDAADE